MGRTCPLHTYFSAIVISIQFIDNIHARSWLDAHVAAAILLLLCEWKEGKTAGQWKIVLGDIGDTRKKRKALHIIRVVYTLEIF